MRVIWAMGSATAAEVEQQVAGRHQWTNATVKTLLGRLVEKGMLATVKDGRCFIYTARITEDEVLGQLAQEFLSKVCETRQALLLEDLIDSCQLTELNIAELIERLRVKQPVARVDCNCVNDFDCCTMHQQNDENKVEMLVKTRK